MTFTRLTAITLAATAIGGGAALADCGIENGRVAILSNDFPALQAMAAGAAECASDTVEVSANQTTEHRDIQVAALTADPAQYTSAVVANSSIVPLLNDGLIRPLDDLIAEHAPDLPGLNRITIDGEVMAVTFMANAQHLYVRTDILEQVGAEVPTTYEEVLDVLAAVREAGIMDHPWAMNTASGWNLGEEFVNMMIGMGGSLFEPGSAEPAVNSEEGIAALEMLAALNDYANPDFLTFDSNATQALWESGELAIAYMWGSRGGGILDDEGAAEGVVENTMLVAAPTVGGGDTPASTLWWDGFTIAANISDEDAEATFIALMNGLRPEIIEANNDAAVWLLEGYTPGAPAAGVSATAEAGATPYPMLPYAGLMHTALGNELAQFLQGEESAEQALADVEAAYIAAAREQGFLD
ncbi:extracellular solute-binding protein [Roseibacterium beibuensis]|uniref:Extracellular solute-binding protein n=1 Tax=[Roseibacterium] beibuensis TaxID=1193142 RepID=A0ABP9L3K9_9RHOB|nr:extracellular solute-binding protein [Roseibacterium beibuensis]MCS6623703.1 extracellular solute-binding protein [Roseibacterium beibuensis]